MRRRTFVTACGVTTLAGCFGADENGPGNESTQQPADGQDTSGNESGGSNESEGEGDIEEDQLGATDPEPIEYSGSGNARTEPFEAQSGLTALRIEPVTGMAIDVVDAGGDVWRSLEWDLRNYQGLVPVDIPQGQYTLAVRTDRDWTIQVIQPEVGDGDLVTPEATLSGAEPQYLGPIDFSEAGSVAIDHAGVGEFSLKLYDLTGEYLQELYNDQGIFEADVTVDYGGQGWLVIAASSDWEIAVQSDGGDTEPTGSRQSEDDGGNSSSGGTNTSGGNSTDASGDAADGNESDGGGLF